MTRIRLLAFVAVWITVPSPQVSAQQSTEAYTYDAVGRLIIVETVSGTRDGETRSICYDPSDNRTQYKGTSNGSAASCAEAGEPHYGGPPPPPPPPPNRSPVAEADSVSVNCHQTVTVNLTGNDGDPDGDYPLILTALSGAGPANAAVISSTSASVGAAAQNSISYFSYTVKDSTGRSATGALIITTIGCGWTGPIDPL